MLATHKFRFLTDRLFFLAILLAVFFVLLIPLFNFPKINIFSQPMAVLQRLLVYPILEELVFRGYLLPFLLSRNALSQKYFGISIANFISSFIFALLHLLYQPWIFIFGIFACSIVFGFFYQRYNSVLPSIVLHIIYNSLFFTALALF